MATPAVPGIPVQQYRRALLYLKPHWASLLLLFGLNIISSAATLAQPYFTKLIIDDAWMRRDTRNLWILAFWITFSAALSIVLGMAVTQVYIRLSAKVLFEMRLDAYRKIQSLSPQYFARTKTGISFRGSTTISASYSGLAPTPYCRLPPMYYSSLAARP